MPKKDHTSKKENQELIEEKEIKNQESDVDELTLTKEKCEEYLNGWKRAQADYHNLKKENERERSEYVKYANGNLLLEILPVYDNFKMAFRQIPDNEKDSAWVVGFSYIKKQLSDFLTNNGIEEIKTVGENFDHDLHEAVEYRESENQEGQILEEIKPGYKLNGKVIQVSKVVVSKKEEKSQE